MKTIIEKSEQYVTELLLEELKSAFVYHNLAHTSRVVEKVKELGQHSNIGQKQLGLLIIAAWFHDTGMIKKVKGHEQESVKIAEKFLEQHNFDEKDIEIVSNLILATDLNREPKTKLECFMRDADCAHVSSKHYEHYAALLKQEWESTTDKAYTDSEWLQNNIDFINTHKYYTETANTLWSKKKRKNLLSLLKKQ